ncbi:MAG: MFS transporter [Ilumatobacter sp.]|nr:MFS transporter [Ilumatobacter sp.]
MSEAREQLPTAYWRQWWASLISNLGDGINFVAMPLLALSLTDDERLLSLTTVATFVPWLIIALPVGVVVDRVDRRLLMVSANLARVGLYALIAAWAIDGGISIWWLVGILLVIGACEVVFDSTAQAFVPMLVEPHQLARANGLLFTAEIVAGSIAGLAFGALLFDVDVGLPFAANALSFAVAAVLLLTIRLRRAPTAIVPRSADDRSLRSAIRWLGRHQLLRTLAVMFTITNLGLMLGQGIFAKFAVDELGLDSLGFGLLLAITAMGAATGGLVGPRIVAAIGLRNSVVAPYLAFGVAQIVIGFAPPPVVVGAAGFVMGFGITVWNVATITVRQRLIPGDQFGRVNGAYRFFGAAASATGIVAGGFVAYFVDLQAPFLLGGGITLAAAVVFAKPVLAGLANDDDL